MYNIILPLTCDTSVYYSYPNDNFNHCLSLQSMSTHCQNISKILFKFPQELFNIVSNNEIVSAKLCFYGCASAENLDDVQICENASKYCCSKVTWDTCPHIRKVACHNSWEYNPLINSVQCDVLDMICNITSNNLLNTGYQIIINQMNSWLNLYSSKSLFHPYLKLYVKPSNSCCRYMLASIDNTPYNPIISIPTCKVIPINTVDTANILELNCRTNEIIIKKPGCYMIDWWIDYSGGNSIDRIILSLKSSKEIIYSSSCPVNSPGFVSGHAIITVSPSEAKNNYSIGLYNNSEPLNDEANAGTLYLSPIAMPASIRITGIQ